MNKRTQYGIAAAVIVAAVGFMIAQQSSSPVVSVHDVYALLNDTSSVILDVRTAPEHAAARITESALIPVQELERRISELERYRSNRIIVYCRTDNRSGAAVSLLRKHGFDAYNMSGGIVRWKSERLPVISGAAL